MAGKCIRMTPEKVKGLKIKSNDGKRAVVQWNGPDGNQMDYNYIICIHSGEEKDKRSDETKESKYAIENLEPGRIYYFSVSAMTGKEQGKTATLEFSAAPLPPTDIQVINHPITPESSFIVKYKDPDRRSNNYMITARSLSDGDEKKPESSEKDFCTLTNLKDGSLYEIYVVTLIPNSEGLENELTSEKSFFQGQAQTYPSKVGSIETEQTSPNSFRISWEQIFGATDYRIDLKNSTSNFATHMSQHSEFTFQNLKRGLKYFVKVAAKNGAGQGKFSNVVEFETDPSPPSNVVVRIDDVTPTLLHVKFDEPEHPPEKYVVCIEENGKDIYEIQTTKSFLPIPNVRLGQVYSMSVRSQNKVGTMKSETVYALPIETEPEKIQNLQCPSQNINSASIKWDEGERVCSYTVYWWIGEQRPNSVETFQPSFSLEDMEPGCIYKFSVAAKNAEKNFGEMSDILEIETVPCAPTNVVATNHEPSPHDCLQVTFKHAAAEGMTFRVVAQTLTEDLTKNISVECSKCSTVVKGLTPGETYTVYVVACRDGKESLKSEYSTLIQTYPERMEDPVHKVEDDSLTISWKPPNIKPIYYQVSITSGDKQEFKQVEGSHFTLRNLAPSTTYSFSVSACNSVGCGERSGILYHTTDPAPPIKVRAKPSTISPETTLEIEYDDPEPSKKKYEIVACLASGEIAKKVESDEKNAIMDGLTPGQTYRIYVVAVQGDRRSRKAYYI